MKYTFLCLLLMIPRLVLSQSVSVSLTLPSVAMLSIQPNSSSLSLTFANPSTAGESLGSSTSDYSKWLNFTSAVNGGTRRITAQITSGSLPNGVNLKVVTGNFSGGGGGSTGSGGTTNYLSGAASVLVNNIGGAYSGVGSGNGYNLGFSLEITDFSALRSTSNSVQITYTLIDN